jgi:uncharacterized membrane protein YfcA
MFWTLALVAAAVGLGSYAQGVSGFGFGLISSPLIAALEGPRAAVIGVAVVATLQSLYVIRRLARDVRWHIVALITSASLLGMPLGLLVFSRLSREALTVVIGTLVIGFAVLLWRGWQLPDTRLTEVLAGIVSGSLATSTGTTGPPLVITFHGRGLQPNEFRASLAAVFTIQGIAAIAFFAIGGKFDDAVWRVVAVGTPAMAVGWLAGNRTFGRIEPERFRRIALGMLVLSGLVALAAGIFGSR